MACCLVAWWRKATYFFTFSVPLMKSAEEFTCAGFTTLAARCPQFRHALQNIRFFLSSPCFSSPSQSSFHFSMVARCVHLFFGTWDGDGDCVGWSSSILLTLAAATGLIRKRSIFVYFLERSVLHATSAANIKNIRWHLAGSYRCKRFYLMTLLLRVVCSSGFKRVVCAGLLFWKGVLTQVGCVMRVVKCDGE